MKRVAVSAVVALTLAVACGVEVDVTNKACPCGDGFVCDTPRNVCVTPAALKAAHPTCDPCPCAGAADCVDPSRSICSSTSKTCVECDPANDTCPAGTYCNAKAQCTAGCRVSADCVKISPASPLCATDRHQCVACLQSTDCQNQETCSPSGACVLTCSTSKPCVGGATCCNALCVDTGGDLLNCGACGTACSSDNGTASCQASVCSSQCANGFAHCGTDNTGCETDTRTDAKNCGACGTVCAAMLVNAADPTCADSICTFTQCAPGFEDGNGTKADGCETQCGGKGGTCCPNRMCLGGGCNGPNAGKCSG